MIFDSNVVIDMLGNRAPDYFHQRIADLGAASDLFVNEIIFAEISGNYGSAQDVADLFEGFGLKIVRLSLPDCHRAGTAYRQYRRNGGVRTSILPDFLIGAQAANRGWPIVTRDRKGFATYFPEVDLIDPYIDTSKA
ncbi:PilT domain-containing protein [Novosphingobium resinovorum]|uniref:PilT domain-containing protein n=1 Tax=Novosphingobium resinovorum TaxID=158500 RepID=A0A031K3Y7_9SPHN|nr:type II toxin-antitoxin system VapC family toxin [Novosphingobium resinovorum]EZP83728.1 PilT domain-containing protein [Novosphingobium resinovorum]